MQYIRKNDDGTLTVFSGDQNTEPKTYDFLIWSGLLRDFARRQNFVNDYQEQDVLRSNVYNAAAGVFASMRNDIRYDIRIKSWNFDQILLL